MALQIEVQRQANELRSLETQAELERRREEQALELQILPVRQVPEVAKALASMYQGANLSVYGNDNALVSTLSPLVQTILSRLKGEGA